MVGQMGLRPYFIKYDPKTFDYCIFVIHGFLGGWPGLNPQSPGTRPSA